MSFNALGLHPLLVQAVAKAGYETPTPVQQQAIPAALEGRDLMVSSATGSGKTAAFMLPALQLMTQPSAKPGKGARVVVLTPTRELAMQVTKACEDYGSAFPNLRTISILGGVPYVHQQRALKQNMDVMVATPGRLIDYMQRGMIDFSRVELLVLDEADRMLDMGFIEDIEHIVSKMPVQRQTVMFSATFGGSVGRVAAQWLRDPLPISVANQHDTHENIEQRLHYTRGYANKVSVLEHLLRDESLNQAIVFTATQREADSLADTLVDQGFVSAPLHGGMNQRQRTRTLQQMHQGRLRVLVATDVAARGLDVQGISHVINFDLPKMAEDYVHRIGRTGRAGRQGVALTLADINERRHVQRIERFTTQRIPVHAIEGLAPIPTETSVARAGRSAPSRGNGAPRSGGGFRDGGRDRPRSGGDAGGRSRFGGESAGRSREPREGGYGSAAPRAGLDAGQGAGPSAGANGYAGNRSGGSYGRNGASGDQRRSAPRSFGTTDRPSWSDSKPRYEGRRFDRDRPAGERRPEGAPTMGEHAGAGRPAAGAGAAVRRRREWSN